MKSKTETFESLISSFQYKYDLHTVFDDFLTMSICSVTRNPKTGLSHYEDLYLKTIERYKTDQLRFVFPKMFAALVIEMEELKEECNDVLGIYYEMNLSKKGSQQFFTPWQICEFMATSTLDINTERKEGEPLRILEPACGSGRMLLAAAKVHGKEHCFYAVDIDPTCVKMTALNLFLNGIFNSEVLCGNFLIPEDFSFSYQLSFVPLGIFRFEEREKSPLWHSIQMEGIAKKDVQNLKLPSEEGNQNLMHQLNLF
jgi:hypothetical protein